MPTLIGLQSFTREQQEQIRAAAPGWTCIFGKAKELDPQIFTEAEIICGWSHIAAKEALHGASRLRWVQSWAAGVDKLPLDQFEQHGVTLTDASGIHPVPMAETAFALMLGLTRSIHLAVRSQTASVWDTGGSYGEMHGKTIGIIGVGEIGRHIAKLSKAFNMRVLGVRRSGEAENGVDDMYTLSGLATVMEQSDYIVNVLPLTSETDGLFDESLFNRVKRGACFINIGRGATVKTEALINALQDGRLASAGLDVYETEPLPPGHPLWSLENVILTPHIGGANPDYDARAFKLFIGNLALYTQGQTGQMRNIVDYSKRY
ncbi:D-2-hydroxyacid dehydrogenase [Paenibacillus pinihumi]|uniref:D-2-hydroxyacid dehydrogenase n=1 Tax=Paenibacillus pinihumi TaxID=669462 RepID=UPI0004182E77|nr:D-2-hydroxyacid dehydrogenase [Paenibacillus pinihumi]